jgi:uncharacterized protein (TIGR00661 family)
VNSKKNILVCPLDWGLGHATRCVPIINELLSLNYNVIIGADKNPLAFLQQEFPQLKSIIIPGYKVTYDEKGSFLKLLSEGIQFNKFIKKEHKFIDTIIEQNNVDIVISDNRYGLWNDKVQSIIITHQLFPKVPIGIKIAHQKIEKLVANFDTCWIPDIEEDNNLSGDLSHLKPFNYPHQFIGALSRFKKQPEIKKEYDVIAIISGPEPQRAIFEEMAIEQIEKLHLKAVLVRGLPLSNSQTKIKSSAIKVFNHLPTEELQQYIQKSKIVVCRSGYSSIMDLVTLNKQAILVPTPGQTEQEYLAEYHINKKNFYTQKQKDFNLKGGLVEVEKYNPKFEIEIILKLDFLL